MSIEPQTQPSVRWVEMTPEWASQLLALNTHNRALRKQAVEKYVGALQRGEWRPNGEAIKISRAGVLHDGQHRLAASVTAGVSFRTLLIEDLPEDLQETMDQGRKRTMSDLLTLRGENNTTTLAAALRFLWLWETQGELRSPGGVRQPTARQLFDVLERHPGIRSAVRWGPSPPGMNKSLAVTLHYKFSEVDEENSVEFFTRLTTGAELSDGDPILMLRNRLLDSKALRPRPHVMAALTIKAFNLWRRGDQIQKLVWKAGGAHPEPFPAIEDDA